MREKSLQRDQTYRYIYDEKRKTRERGKKVRENLLRAPTDTPCDI